ncbi:MAG: hypothetical protein ACXAEF_03320 [Candidatus Thorarchaeota archaeon]
MEDQRKQCFNIYFIVIVIGAIIAFALIPVTSGVSFVTFWFIGAISMIAWVFFSGIVKRKRTLDDAIIIAEAFDYEEESIIDNKSDQYRFPKRCPNCNEDLHLGKVKWVDSSTGLCPNCESTIRVR